MEKIVDRLLSAVLIALIILIVIGAGGGLRYLVSATQPTIAGVGSRIEADEIVLRPGGRIVVQMDRGGKVVDCVIGESMIRRIVTCP